MKSKSENTEIKSLKNLYKVGFSRNPVHERIKNASKEATYLFADVEVVASYNCYSNNCAFWKFSTPLFAEVCLNIDLYDKSGNRYIPREWFVVPSHIIDEVIQLLLNGNIIHHKYNVVNKRIELK